MYSVINLLLIKTAGTPRLSQLTPQTPTYPSSGKIGGGIIKLYQSRCFYIYVCAEIDTKKKAFSGTQSAEKGIK